MSATVDYSALTDFIIPWNVLSGVTEGLLNLPGITDNAVGVAP
jgi:hypothetical protein